MTSGADAAILDAVRRYLIPSLALACNACAPAAPVLIQAPAVVQAPAPASAPLQPAAPIPEPVAAARRPAFAAAVDGAQTDRFLVTLLGALEPGIRQIAERELGLNPGALSQPSVLSVFGIDPTRPMVFGLASLDDRGRALVDEARRAAPGSGGSDKTSARDKVVSKLARDRDGSEVHFSFVIPTIDSALALDRMQKLLDSAGWNKSPEPQGFESVWSRREKLMAITASGDSLTVDLADVGERGARAVELLHGRSMSLRESLRAAAPPLEGNTARMTFSPSLLAEVGFFGALALVHRVIRDVDEEYRNRILQEGFQEASRILDLSGGRSGAYFETVEIALQTNATLPGISGVAIAGPGTQVPSAGACAPSLSLELPDADVTYDATNACLRALKLPGDPEDGSIERSRYQDWARDAGAWGRFAALPFIPGGIARERLISLHGLAPGALQKFERFGWMAPHNTTSRSLFWGMLPAGTAQRDAVCAVTNQPAPCVGKMVLAPGRTQEVEQSWARLVRVGDRWVLLLSTDKASIEKVSPILTRAPVPAIRAELEARVLRREFPTSMLSFPLEGWTWRGSATWEGNSFRVTFQPVQQKP